MYNVYVYSVRTKLVSQIFFLPFFQEYQHKAITMIKMFAKSCLIACFVDLSQKYYSIYKRAVCLSLFFLISTCKIRDTLWGENFRHNNNYLSMLPVNAGHYQLSCIGPLEQL